VLRLVAVGWTNDRIAAELFLSPRTVHAHLTSVYRKLGVANRAEAVRVAVERGLG
jgi:DNA-binding NarL/FixJ family response regulator